MYRQITTPRVGLVCSSFSFAFLPSPYHLRESLYCYGRSSAVVCTGTLPSVLLCRDLFIDDPIKDGNGNAQAVSHAIDIYPATLDVGGCDNHLVHGPKFLRYGIGRGFVGRMTDNWHI